MFFLKTLFTTYSNGFFLYNGRGFQQRRFYRGICPSIRWQLHSPDFLSAKKYERRWYTYIIHWFQIIEKKSASKVTIAVAICKRHLALKIFTALAPGVAK